MHVFTVKTINKMGQADPTYGQAYWGYVEEQQQPIKFNITRGDVQDGQKITAEEMVVKKSSKGTDYYQLKKVRTQDNPLAQAQAHTQSNNYKDNDAIKAEWAIGQAVQIAIAAGLGNNIDDDIEVMAKKLYAMVDRVKSPKAEATEGSADAQSGYEAAKQARENLDTVVEDFDQEEPINLDDIPF